MIEYAKTGEDSKKSSQNIKVCVRLRPLFASEKQAAQWIIDRERNFIKVIIVVTIYSAWRIIRCGD